MEQLALMALHTFASKKKNQLLEWNNWFWWHYNILSQVEQISCWNGTTSSGGIIIYFRK